MVKAVKAVNTPAEGGYSLKKYFIDNNIIFKQFFLSESYNNIIYKQKLQYYHNINRNLQKNNF